MECDIQPSLPENPGNRLEGLWALTHPVEIADDLGIPMELFFYQALPIKKPSKTQDSERPWVYLGQHQDQMGRWTEILGAKNRISTGLRLEKQALKLRQSFTHWVGHLAQKAHEPWRFWAITFTARSPETSNIFQLFCLAQLCLSEINQNPKNAALKVVVEDPWLFQALAPHFLIHHGSWQARRDRMRSRIRCYARVIPARISFLVRGTSRLLLARILRLGGSFHPKTVSLVSYALPSSLDKNTYYDPFFGYLPELLKNLDFKTVHLFPLHTPSKFFKKIARIPSGQVLATWASFKELLFSSLSWAQLPQLTAPLQFEKLDVGTLIQKELLEENASNRYVLNVWQALTWMRYSKYALGSMIYLFENHPWEKGLNFALSKRQVRRIGYQHSTVPSLLMNHIPAGEAEHPFHPEVILSNSPENQVLLQSYGWAHPRASKVLVAGALRYPSPIQSLPKTHIRGGTQRNPKLCVAFPGTLELSTHLLTALSRSIRTDSQTKLLLKFHPSIRPNQKIYQNIPHAQLTDQPLKDLAAQLDALLFASTTLGLEALLMGLPVYRYIPEGLLSMDPIPPFLSSLVQVCDHQTLGNIISHLPLRQTQLKPHSEAKNLLYFPIDDQVWKKTLEDHPGHRI